MPVKVLLISIFTHLIEKIFIESVSVMRSYKNHTDGQLLQLLNDNDCDAFTEIYNRYWEVLVDMGYSFTKDKQAVEEIVNDIFIRLWKRHECFQIRSLRQYLGTAVKFGVFKSLLKSKRRKELLKDYSETILSIEEEQRIEAKFMEAYLNDVIESLPERSRLIYRYSRDKAMNVTEISRQMNMQPKAVEYHITKTLKILRNALHIIDDPKLLLLGSVLFSVIFKKYFFSF